MNFHFRKQKLHRARSDEYEVGLTSTLLCFAKNNFPNKVVRLTQKSFLRRNQLSI